MEKQKFEFTIPSNCKATTEIVGDKVLILCEPIEKKRKELSTECGIGYFFENDDCKIGSFISFGDNTKAKLVFRKEQDLLDMQTYAQLIEARYQLIGDKESDDSWKSIFFNSEYLDVSLFNHYFFSFPTKEMAQKFLDDYRKEFEQIVRFI